MKKFFGILWKIIKVLLWILVLLIVGVILVQRVSNNKVTIANYSIYTVVTPSMVPKYQVFDMVLAKKVDVNSLAVGDDVVYMGREGSFNGKIITHQIIGIDNTNGLEFHTKGLANSVEDPVVKSDQVYGKVLTKLGILSFLSRMVSSQYGLFFIIIVPAVIFVFQVFIDIMNAKKKSD